MADMGIDLYESMYEIFPETRANLTTESGDAVDCLCSGITLTREASEIGLGETPSCVLRVLAAAEPETGLEMGKLITLTDAAGDAHQLRVKSRLKNSGVLVLTMEAQHGG